MSEGLSRRDLALLAAMFAVTALFYCLVLFRYPIIYGIDGPYYLIQVRSILETGFMTYYDPPFCFYFFSLLALILGDVTVAVKLGTAFFCALTVIPAYLIGRRLTLSPPAAISCATVTSLSPGLISLSGEFVKNAVGSFFLLCFVYFCLRILKGDDKRVTKVTALAALLLTAATHILDLGLALLYLILMSIGAFVFRTNRRGFLAFSLPLLVGCAVLGGAAYFVYAGYTIDIGKGLTFAQDFLQSLEEYDVIDSGEIIGSRVPAIVGTVGGVVALALYRRRGKNVEVAFVSASVLVLVLLNFPTIPREWAWRFMLMSFVPMSQIAGGLVGLLTEHDVQWGMAALLVSFFVLTQTLSAWNRPRPVLSPQEYSDMVEMAGHVPTGSKVVGMPQSRYWIEYLLRSQIFRPSSDEQVNYTVYFIAGPRSPSVPPGSTLILRGAVLSLFALHPRRPA